MYVFLKATSLVAQQLNQEQDLDAIAQRLPLRSVKRGMSLAYALLNSSPRFQRVDFMARSRQRLLPFQGLPKRLK